MTGCLRKLGKMIQAPLASQTELQMQKHVLHQAHAEQDVLRGRSSDFCDPSLAGYCLVSEHGLILETNRIAATLMGSTPAELINQSITRFILDADQDICCLHHKRFFATGEPQVCELRMVKTNGATFWGRLETSAAKGEDGAPACRMLMRDITEGKFQEEAQDLTGRLNSLVDTSGDLREHMSRLTAFLQDWSGCEAVGIRLRNGDDYPYYETRGFSQAFVQAENHLCAYGPDGEILRDSLGNPVLECMCGNILCGRFDPAKPFFTAQGSFWSNNTSALLASTTEADRQAPSRNRCNLEGYESVALIPLRAAGQVFGLLQFNDQRPDRFSPGLMARFERSADSLALALSRRQAVEALRKSETDLREAQEIARLGRWELDLSANRLAWSDGIFALFEVDPETFAASYEAFLAFVHPEDRALVDSAYRESVAHKKPYEIEHRLRMTDGRIKWVSEIGRSEYDEAGAPIRSIGIVQDITARKQAEEALLKSEARHGKMVANIGDVIVIIDADGINRYKSPNIERWFGWKPEELVGASTWENVHPEDLAAAQKFLGALLDAPNAARTTEIRYRCKDGGYKWIEFTGVNLSYDPDIMGILGNYRDITERKKAEQALRESEAFVRVVMDNLPIGIAVNSIDPAVKFVYMNDNFPTYYRTTRAALGHPDGFWDSVYEDPEFRAEIKQRVLDDCASGDPERMHWEDVPITRQGGETTFVSARSTPIPDMPLMLSSVWEVTARKRAEEALAAKTRTLEMVFESAPYIMMLVDEQGRVTEINRVGVSFAGRGKDQLLGLLGGQVLGCLNSSDGRGCGQNDVCELCPVRSRVMHTFRTGEPIHEGRGQLHIQKDSVGVMLELLVSTTRVQTAGGTQVLVTIADVTDRVRAEEAIANSHRLLTGLLDAVPDLLMVVDKDLKIHYSNDKGHDLVGHSDSADQATCYGRFKRLDAPCTDCSASEVFARGGTVEREMVNPADGRHREVRAFPILDAAGRVQFVAEHVRDITDRKTDEQALRQFKRIFDTANFGAMVVDLSGRLTYVNDCFAAVHGYGADELLGQSLKCLHNAEQMQQVDRLLKQLNADGSFNAQEVGHCRRDGTAFPMLMTGTLIRNTTGAPHCFAVTAIDLVERKALETQLQQAQKMESVGRLAGGVAHDFNNMLGVILGHMEMALEQVGPTQPLFADLLEVRKAAQRAADLTRQLLAFARKQTIAPKVLDLNETVEGMLKMLRRVIGEDIDLAWLPGRHLWPVEVDPSQIDQILANLCVNARDAIAGVGKITMETANAAFDAAYCAEHPGFAPGEFTMLAVSDDGSGMDQETLGQIFEPFFTTKGVGQGTGLGLAMVYGVVEQNHGFIKVYSAPGEGTAFRIYLPRHVGEAAPTGQEGPEESVSRGNETVLLVEDEPAMLKLGALMLKRLGYEVLGAGLPGAAIELAEAYNGAIHLVITDVVMPGMNGRDLARRLQSVHPGITCLFMSGYTADVIARHGVLDQGVHFIQKPFSAKDLAAKVREAIEGG
jgi:PAS domain S-box-containing protein